MGMWERDAQACAAVAVCALLRDPDSPAGARQGLCARPTLTQLT